jgi:O-antigen ligase
MDGGRPCYAIRKAWTVTTAILQRIRGRLAAAVVAMVFAAPLTGVFTHPEFGWPYRFLVAALILVSASSPPTGLLALVTFLPVSAALQVLLAAGPVGMDVSDSWLMAFVVGVSFRVVPALVASPSRLTAVAAVLLTAVVTSTATELSAMQAVVPRQPLLPDVWRHVTTDYWIFQGDFPAVHLALRWSGWLVLAACAERITLDWAGDRARILRGWVLGGTAGAAMVLIRIAEVVLQSEVAAGPAFMAVVREVRLSVLHPDVNAAGSYFALFLVPAIILWRPRRREWLWSIALPLLMTGFVFARSRAAMGAVVMALGVQWSRMMTGRHRTAGLIAGAALAAAVLGGAMVLTSESNVGLGDAIRVRADMTQVAWRTMMRHPVFGVGLPDYIRVSRRQITPEMEALRAFAPQGENAHNNLLQFGAELGVPALLLFLALVLPVAWRGWSEPSGSPPAAMALGVAAFLVTAVFGHPLLIPLVGAGFFLAVGLTPGLAGRLDPAPAWLANVLWAVAVFYMVSAVFRV